MQYIGNLKENKLAYYNQKEKYYCIVRKATNKEIRQIKAKFKISDLEKECIL